MANGPAGWRTQIEDGARPAHSQIKSEWAGDCQILVARRSNRFYLRYLSNQAMALAQASVAASGR